jgi:hypothetical protein
MQLHGPAQSIEEGDVSVHLNPGNSRPFAVMDIGGVSLYITAPEECDWLIKAAVEAKRLILAVPDGDPVAPRCESQHITVAGTSLRCSLEQDHPDMHAALGPGGVRIAAWDDDEPPDPDACTCGHPGYRHTYGGTQPCGGCDCKAFTAAPSGGVMFGPFSPEDGTPVIVTDDKPPAPVAIVRPSAVCGAKNPAARGDCTRHRGHKGGHTNTAAGTYWRDVTEASRA